MTLTAEELLSAFTAYNEAIWPTQWMAYGLGVVALALLFRRSRLADRAIAGILAFFWAWAGLGFSVYYFGPIFTPAYAFAAFMVAESLILLGAGWKGALRFRPLRDGYTAFGVLLVAYALIGFPLVGMAVGHRYPEAIAFGLTPCPVTVFTLGLLLMLDGPAPRRVVIVPLLWVLGSILPISLGIWEDLGLGLLGLLALILLIQEARSRPDVVVAIPGTSGVELK